MSDTSPMAPSPPPVPTADTANAWSLRSLVIVGYVLFLIACFNGLTAIVGLIIAYVKRRDAAGTIWESHLANLILVFWVMVGGMLLGLLSWPLAFGWLFAQHFVFFWPPTAFFPLLLGIILFPVLAVWYLYRVIRGLIRASEDRPY